MRFAVLVIVPPDVPDIMQAVQAAMAPYDADTSNLADTPLNPQGYWDGWMLHDLAEDVRPTAQGQPCDYVVQALITPDGIWHEVDHLAYYQERTPARLKQIRQESQALLDRYPAHLAVELDCHL